MTPALLSVRCALCASLGGSYPVARFSAGLATLRRAEWMLDRPGYAICPTCRGMLLAVLDEPVRRLRRRGALRLVRGGGGASGVVAEMAVAGVGGDETA